MDNPARVDVIEPLETDKRRQANHGNSQWH
jgi:hypothetical protein